MSQKRYLIQVKLLRLNIFYCNISQRDWTQSIPNSKFLLYNNNKIIIITLFSLKHHAMFVAKEVQIKQWQHTWRHLFCLPKSKTANVKLSCKYKCTYAAYIKSILALLSPYRPLGKSRMRSIAGITQHPQENGPDISCELSPTFRMKCQSPSPVWTRKHPTISSDDGLAQSAKRLFYWQERYI